MQTTHERAAYLAALFARRELHLSAGKIALDVQHLRKSAVKINRLAIKACNVQLTKRDEITRDNATGEVHKIAKRYKLEASTSGDPRGCVVKLWKPGEYDKDGAAGDSWGGGWAVY